VKLLLALALTFPAFAQQAAAPLTPPPTPELHAKALQIVEMSGGRQRILASMPALIEQGTAAMRKQCPDCNPAFFDEWGKRMAARLTPDDFLNVAVRAYESRFTLEELTEFMAVATAQKAGKPIMISVGLQAKMQQVMPSMMGEINGGSTELGARLGMQIGAEIQKEHPEYVPTKPPVPPQP
jgi:hypothetical protein